MAKKKTLFMIVRIALILLLTLSFTECSNLQQGTLTNPYLVTSANDLLMVGKGSAGTPYQGWTLDKHYKQTENITLSGGWMPIGTGVIQSGPHDFAIYAKEPFTGSYDGGGYKISGLTINLPSIDLLGMFGFIAESGIVKNVILINANISGNSNCTGGVAGSNKGTVINCSFNGNVSGRAYTGGIVGVNWDGGTIKNCYSGGNITGIDGTGGVAGGNEYKSTIQNCFSTGNVTGVRQTGGVLGRNLDSVLVNCYSTCNVNFSGGAAGGIAGGVTGWNGGTVQNCAALNTAIKGTQDAGRVAGYINEFNGVLIGNYATEGLPHFAREATANGKDGKDIALNSYKNKNFWVKELLFQFGSNEASPWKWDSGANLPKLFFEK